MVPPVANKLRAIAARISSAFILILKYAKNRVIRIPVNIATINPAIALWNNHDAITANKAENNMIPSIAMFVIPTRAAINAASAAKRIGVIERITPNQKSGFENNDRISILRDFSFLCFFCSFYNTTLLPFTQE